MFLRIRLFGTVALALLSLMVNGAFAASTNEAPAKVFYVDSRFQGNAPTGESWFTAFPSLQDAIDAAAENGGGEVWVKSGTYSPGGTQRSSSFKLKTGVHLYGGFRGDETNREERNPKAYLTTLSGNIGQLGENDDNCYHVLTAASETSLNGFTIKLGLADGEDEESFGGGLHVLQGSRQVTVTDCTFEDNHAEQAGGAVFLSASEVSFTNCTFYSNGTDKNGGALATSGETSLQISSSFFSANRASWDGGALFLEENASASIQDSFFRYNTAQENGGALAAKTKNKSARPIELTNCTFQENTAKGNGGATYFSGPFAPVISKCSFDYNIGGIVGAVGIENNCVTLVQECTFGRNRGNKGAENMGTDKTSSFITTEEEFLAKKPTEEPNNPEPPKIKSIPNISVLKPEDRSLIKLQELVSARKYTLLILGDLTNPDFIENYKNIEAIAQNHQSNDLQAYYIQRRPTRPGNHGYLTPFNENEMAQLAKVSASLLKTRTPWICDTLDNEVVLQLPPNLETDVFIYSADGSELFTGSIQKPDNIRRKLTQLLGEPKRNIRPSQLPNPDIEPLEIEPANLVKRISFNPNTQKYVPLLVIPQEPNSPHYIKLRAEADAQLLETGEGKLYIGFHPDKLYNAQWNNKADPLQFALASAVGSITPSSQSAPSVNEASDSEPREFLITASRQNIDLPIQLKVTYSVQNTAQRISQIYYIYLKEDPLGGKAYRRQIAYQDPIPDFRINQNTAMPNALRDNDDNNDGKIERNELNGILWIKFHDIDSNRDGYINSSEYNAYLRDR
ncbi:MAG: right-handed parallel beta-helix repeat-containing protein [Pontiellaceae bacterium]|nr:right-handed parallel beta-helix repeat-containing protein [Pontiellaceae bacterium]